VPLLREARHEAIAVDLPGDDETAGLPEYTSLVTGAIGGRDDVVLVAQSLGGSPPRWPRRGPASGADHLTSVRDIPGAWSGLATLAEDEV
jgi:hypothetical protein